MINWDKWSGDKFIDRVYRGDMPEYLWFLDSAGRSLPHNNPYHGEDMLTHIRWVIDNARRLAEEKKLEEIERDRLLAAATWHDVGKAWAREQKIIWLCPECGHPHPGPGKCSTPGCDGIPVMKEVTRFPGHEALGATRWMAGNILDREEVPLFERGKIRELIRNHDQVLYGMRDRLQKQYDPLGVLLSWSDETGRIPPRYQPHLDPGVFEEYYRRGRNATRS